MKIKQTPQQRANTIEALEVMWPSVPPENVMPRLSLWRRNSGAARQDRGSVCCFGGWCAWWPSFRAQGVYADEMGAPRIGGRYGCEVAQQLFGWDKLFVARGFSNIDNLRLSDHELVTHRLKWLLANIEVVNESI